MKRRNKTLVLSVLLIASIAGIIVQSADASQRDARTQAIVITHPSQPTPSPILPIAAVTASSAQHPNVPGNAIDGDMGTRWSAQGDGEWIQFQLKRCETVSLVRIAWFQGDSRFASFDIEISIDGTAWTLAYSGDSNGQTLGFQEVDLTADPYACFVRIVGFGTSVNRWNSITEVEIEDGIWVDGPEAVPVPLSLLQELCAPLLKQQ